MNERSYFTNTSFRKNFTLRENASGTMPVGAGSRPIPQIRIVKLNVLPCYSSTDVTATAAWFPLLALTQHSKQRLWGGTDTLTAAFFKWFLSPKAFQGCFPSISFTFKSSARSGCKAPRYGEINERDARRVKKP